MDRLRRSGGGDGDDKDKPSGGRGTPEKRDDKSPAEDAASRRGIFGRGGREEASEKDEGAKPRGIFDRSGSSSPLSSSRSSDEPGRRLGHPDRQSEESGRSGGTGPFGRRDQPGGSGGSGGGSNPFGRRDPAGSEESGSGSTFGRRDQPGGGTAGGTGSSPFGRRDQPSGGSGGSAFGGSGGGGGGSNPFGRRDPAGGEEGGSGSTFGRRDQPSGGTAGGTGSSPFGRRDQPSGGSGGSAFGGSGGGSGSSPFGRRDPAGGEESGSGSTFGRRDPAGGGTAGGTGGSSPFGRRDQPGGGTESGGGGAFGRRDQPSGGTAAGRRDQPGGGSAGGGTGGSSPFGRRDQPGTSSSGSAIGGSRDPGGGTGFGGRGGTAGGTASGGAGLFGRGSSAATVPAAATQRRGEIGKKEEPKKKEAPKVDRAAERAKVKEDKKKAREEARNKVATKARATKKADALPSAPRVHVTHRALTVDQKLDIAGVVLVLAALLMFAGWLGSLTASPGSDPGFLTGRVDHVLARLFGIVRVVIPLTVVTIGGWLLVRHFGRALDIDYLRLTGFGILYLGLLATAQWWDLMFTKFPDQINYVVSAAALEQQSQALSENGEAGGWFGHFLYINLRNLVGDYGIVLVLIGFWLFGAYFAFDISVENIGNAMNARRRAREVRRQETVPATKVPETAVAAVAAATASSTVVSEGAATGGRRRPRARDVQGRETAPPETLPQGAKPSAPSTPTEEDKSKARRGIFGGRTQAPSDQPITAETDGAAPQRAAAVKSGRVEAPSDKPISADTDSDGGKRRLGAGIFGRRQEDEKESTPVAGKVADKTDGKAIAVERKGEVPLGRKVSEAPTDAPITAATDGDAPKRASLAEPVGRKISEAPKDTSITADTDGDSPKRRLGSGIFGRRQAESAPEEAKPAKEDEKPATSREPEAASRPAGIFGRRSTPTDATLSPATPAVLGDKDAAGGELGLRRRPAGSTETPSLERGRRLPETEGSLSPAGSESGVSDAAGRHAPSLFGRGRTTAPESGEETVGLGATTVAKPEDSESAGGVSIASAAAIVASASPVEGEKRPEGLPAKASLSEPAVSRVRSSPFAGGEEPPEVPSLRHPDQSPPSTALPGQRRPAGVFGRSEEVESPSGLGRNNPFAKQTETTSGTGSESLTGRRSPFARREEGALPESASQRSSEVTETKAEVAGDESPSGRRPPGIFGRQPSVKPENDLPGRQPSSTLFESARPAETRSPLSGSGAPRPASPPVAEGEDEDVSTASAYRQRLFSRAPAFAGDAPAETPPSESRAKTDSAAETLGAGLASAAAVAVAGKEESSELPRRSSVFFDRSADAALEVDGGKPAEKPPAEAAEAPSQPAQPRGIFSADDAPRPRLGDRSALFRRSAADDSSSKDNGGLHAETPAISVKTATVQAEDEAPTGVSAAFSTVTDDQPIPVIREMPTAAATESATPEVGNSLRPPSIASAVAATLTAAQGLERETPLRVTPPTPRSEPPAAVPPGTGEPRLPEVRQRRPTPAGSALTELTGTEPQKKSETPVGPRYVLPEFRSILQEGSVKEIDDKVLIDRARMIEETLNSFGAPGKVVEINSGPVITQFGVEPDFLEKKGGARSRVKVSAIASLDRDIALALAARSIRIEAPVPGKGYVGIEVPNAEAALVSLRDVMMSDQHQKAVEKSSLAISLGKRVDGTPTSADLTQMPHLLIAGTTGSGKSVCVNAIISCLLLQNTPDELQMIMVDPKRVELAGYNGIPHLVAPVVVDLERIVGVLKWVQREMDDRYKRFAAISARNIIDFNSKLSPSEAKMPYLVVIVDELADLMMLAPDETERLIARLAQMARATGIHLIISTQRPSVDIITGLIKANFPARIAFAVASSVDSRVILDQPGAEKLLGRGDMLYQAPDAASPTRMQGVYVSDPELNAITNYWKSTRALRSNADKAPDVKAEPLSARPKPVTADGLPEIRRTAPPIVINRVEDKTPVEKPALPVRPATANPEDKQKAFWEEVEAAENEDINDDDVGLDGEDDLYDEAVELVRSRNKASISMLQRHFRIGYVRSARLIDLMEERGIVGPAESGAKPRRVIQADSSEE